MCIIKGTPLIVHNVPIAGKAETLMQWFLSLFELTPISPPLLRFIEEAELSHSEPADGQPLFSGHCSLVIAFSGNSAWTEIRGCQRGWDTENQRHLLYYVINRSHAPEDLEGARASEVPKSLSF